MGQPGYATGIRPTGLRTGEVRRHATCDPCLLKSGNISFLMHRQENMQEFSRALQETESGTIISIEVTAGSRRVQFPEGFNAWRNTLGCAVSAPPVEGRANKAIIELIAKTLDIPKSKVSLLAGAGSTQKKVLVQGIGLPELSGILEKLL